MKKVLLPLFLCLFSTALVSPAFAQSGSLDPTFGNAGIVKTSFGSDTFQFTGAALAPNGDIVVVGNLALPVQSPDPQLTEAVVLRYLPSGALDTTFGTNGMATIPPPVTGSSFGTLGAIQSNGDILVSLITIDFTGITFTPGESILIRLQSNGKPDPTFGVGGEISLSNFPMPSGYTSADTGAIQVQSDGKILVSGMVTPPFRSKLPNLTLLSRFLTNGAADTSFGGSGTAEVAAIGEPSVISFSGTNILVANFFGAIAEFSSAGALLKTSPSPLGAVAVSELPTEFQTNGDVLVGATTGSPEGFKDSSDAIVVRYTLGGVDTTFESPVMRIGPDAPFVVDAPVGVGTDSQGRVLAGIGLSFVEGRTGTPLFGLARLTSNGSFDTTFGSGGMGPVLSNVVFNQILVQPNNDVIAVGSGILARFLGQ